MASGRRIGRSGVSVPTLSAGGGARLAAACAAAALTAFFAAADPVYGPDYGPTDFTLPGAFATTNFYPVPATGTVRYVAPNVPKGSANSGTSFSSPWNLYDALNGGRAQDDTTLILSGGVYRVAQYTADALRVKGKRLTIQPYLDNKVWLKGSVVIDTNAFTQEGPLWYTEWTKNFKDMMGANRQYYINEAVNPIADWGDMVFDRDGQPLTQVAATNELGPARFCVDLAAKRLYIGDDPSVICPVEAAACTNGLIVSSVQSLTLRGIGLAHFANRGLYVVYTAAQIENCVSVWNGNYGLGMPYAHGSTVRGNTLACNGQNGAEGGGRDVTYEGNLLAYNNIERFAIWGAAGIKATNYGSSNMVFRGNVFERNYTGGLWLDCSVYNALVCGNVARFNEKSGIFVEISDSTCVAFNTAYGNGSRGIGVLNSPRTRVYNNTLADNACEALYVCDTTRTNGPSDVSYDPNSAAAGNMWDTYTTQVANNIFSDAPASENALLNAHLTAWPGQASFAASGGMVTLSKNNAYHRPDAAADLISARKSTTASTTNYTSLALFRQHYPGFEADSFSKEGAEPFFSDAAARDYRPRAGGSAIGVAAALPADIAERCGKTTAIGYVGALAPDPADGWWRFDETGTVTKAYDSVCSCTGTVTGASRVAGKGVGALNFDGVNDYVGFGTNLAHLT